MRDHRDYLFTMEWWNRVVGLASNAISSARRNILPRDTGDELEWTTIALASSLISEGWENLTKDDDRVGKNKAVPSSSHWTCYVVSQAQNTRIRRGEGITKQSETAAASSLVLKTGTRQVRGRCSCAERAPPRRRNCRRLTSRTFGT